MKADFTEHLIEWCVCRRTSSGRSFLEKKNPIKASLAREAHAQTRQARKTSDSSESPVEVVIITPADSSAASPLAAGDGVDVMSERCTPPRTPAPSLDHGCALSLPEIGDPEVARRMEQLPKENQRLRTELKRVKSTRLPWQLSRGMTNGLNTSPVCPTTPCFVPS